MAANPSGIAQVKTCSACGKNILKGATICAHCKFPLGKEVSGCINCGKLIPLGAPFCSECQLYTTGKRHFSAVAIPVALLAGIIGVVSAVLPAVSYFLERDSHTRFKVTSSDKDHVVLKAWNTGRKPSTLLSYRLIFNGLPDKEMTLDLSHSDKLEAKNVIAPGAPVRIALTNPLPAMIPESRRGKQYLASEIDELRKKPLSDLTMTLEIDVEESNDPVGSGYLWVPVAPGGLTGGVSWNLLWPRLFHTRSDAFPGDRIQEFIEQKM
jgi:predicted nucleic acid-binding Zn ribbon protein